jgi:hypothetical protein
VRRSRGRNHASRRISSSVFPSSRYSGCPFRPAKTSLRVTIPCLRIGRRRLHMVCNRCGEPASAQCRKCGRFVCSEHFIDDFGCVECFRTEIRDTEASEGTREIEIEESKPNRPRKFLSAALVVLSLFFFYACSLHSRGFDLLLFGLPGMVFWGGLCALGLYELFFKGFR